MIRAVGVINLAHKFKITLTRELFVASVPFEKTCTHCGVSGASRLTIFDTEPTLAGKLLGLKPTRHSEESYLSGGCGGVNYRCPDREKHLLYSKVNAYYTRTYPANVPQKEVEP